MTTPLPFVRLLASVTSEAEARLAAEHGVDVIDCKDPASGALGALPVEVVATIRAAVPSHSCSSECHPGRRASAEPGSRGQSGDAAAADLWPPALRSAAHHSGRGHKVGPHLHVPVSATIGDLPLDPEIVVRTAHAMAATGVDIVKVGLFPGGDAKETIRRLGREIGTPLVAVMIADAPLDLALIDDLGEAGFAGVMLDTASKDGRTLRDHKDDSTLASFIARARNAGLFAGLAGSLRLADIPALLALGPDILGFRGALCRERNRKSALDASALAAVRAAIPHVTSPPPLWGRSGGGESQTRTFWNPPAPSPSPQGEGDSRALSDMETTS